MASVKKNFLLNSSFQLTKVIIPLFTVPYLSRVLGPENIGIYSYTHSVANYFVMVAMLGMSTYGVRLIASSGDDREKRSKRFWSAYASQLIVFTLVVIAYAAYLRVVPDDQRFICILWAMWVFSSGLDITWLLFGSEDFKAPTVRSITILILQLVLIFLLVKTQNDLWIYVTITASGSLLSQAVLWPFINRYVDFWMPTWKDVRKHFMPNMRLFIPAIAISLYVVFDKVVLGALSTMVETGYYEYAYKMTLVPLAFITALGTVMLPRMSNVFAAGNRESGIKLLESSMWIMQLGAMAVAFGLLAVAPEFVPVFFGDEFLPCTELMCVLVVILPAVSGSNVIGRQYLIPVNRDTGYTLSVVFGAVANLVIVFVLIPELGAMGAAIGSTAAEVVVLISQCIMVKDELPLKTYILNTIPFLIIGIAMAVAVRAVSSALITVFGLSVATLLLEILIGVLFYSVSVVSFCVFTNNRHFQYLFGVRLARVFRNR